MEERVETRIAPEVVWRFWEQKIKGGQKGSFQILDIREGESFSILCKALFVRMIFKHTVKPLSNGSEICYGVQIKGLFAAPVRWFLGRKIQRNISCVLKAIVKELESQRVK